MWSSVAASGFGDRVIQLTALTLLGGNQKGVDGTSITAGISFYFFLPYLLLGLPAGWLADKLPRKWIMLGCDESRAALLLLAFVLVPAAGAAAIPIDHHWKVYAMIFGVGVFAAIFQPARNATIPQIVRMDHLQQANALILGIAVIASLLGMGLAGALIDPENSGTLRICLWIGFIMFAVSGTFFAFLKIHRRTGAALSQSDRGKVVAQKAGPYVWQHRTICRLILINMFVWGAAMVVYNAAMGLCKTQYGFSEDVVIARYVVMAMALGAGMLGGAIWVAWMNTRRESGAVAMFGLLMAGIACALLTIVHWFPLGVVLAFAVGFFGNTTIICVTTLIQALSPDYMRGRIMGVNSLLDTIVTVAVNLIIWLLPNADSLVITITKVMAAAMVLIATIGLYREMALRPTANRTLNAMWRINRLYTFVWHRLRVIGRQNVPPTGSVLLAANHTTGIDPMVMQAGLMRIARWVMVSEYRYRILEVLWRNTNPISLDGNASDLTQIRAVITALKQGQMVGLFPEGQLQRDVRELQPLQPGIGMIARRSGAQIVPVWIDGTPLAKGMFWHFVLPSRTTVIFGKPYTVDKSHDDQQIVEDLRERLLTLSQQVPAR
jgi:1-acyl-sn-glycerol-3-phosphate acyltransferase